MLKFISLIIIGCFVSSLHAQTDSLKIVTDISIPQKLEWYKTKYIKESIVPLGLATASLTILAIPNLKENLQAKLNWNNQAKSSYIDLGDDYVRYAPIVAAYLLSDALTDYGFRPKHKFIDRTAILAVAYIASDFVVHNTKQIVKAPRPDKTENTSMPSQHTAMAFVAASFLDHELGHVSPWISVGGYAAASYVGYARVARNAHYTPDVLMGAAVGILMTNATYWAYDGVMKLLPERLIVSPIADFQQTGVYVCYKF